MKSADGNSGSSLVGICLYGKRPAPPCQAKSIKINSSMALSVVLPADAQGTPGPPVTEVQENSGGETKSAPGVAGATPSASECASEPPGRLPGRYPQGSGIPGCSFLCRGCGCPCCREPAYAFLPGRGNQGGLLSTPAFPFPGGRACQRIERGKSFQGHTEHPGEGGVRERGKSTGEGLRGQRGMPVTEVQDNSGYRDMPCRGRPGCSPAGMMKG